MPFHNYGAKLRRASYLWLSDKFLLSSKVRAENLAWYSALVVSVVSYRHQDEENRNQIGVRLGSQKKIVRLRKSLRWRTILRGSVEGMKSGFVER